VVIYTKGKEYHFPNAKVQATNMQGQVIYYILGEPTITDRKKAEKKEEKPQKYTKEDVELVMMQTGVSEQEAIRALEETDGQPAEAILKLMK
ncbi:MAG: nascent polypeptide-associated complex protein, partial [Thermoplasmata archaeon]